MPAYRVHFYAQSEGDVIISADSEEEAKADFEAQVRDGELWVCRDINSCMETGDYEVDSIEKVSEDWFYRE